MKAFKYFGLVLDVAFCLMVVSTAFAQGVGIEGTGSGELMEFIRRITSIIFYISLTGCLGSLMFAGYKISTGDQKGMDAVKWAMLGTAIVAGSSGFFKYIVFAGQDTGVGGKGDLF